MTILRTAALFLLATLLAAPAWAQEPPPGSVYREYALTMSGNDWRVTDPDATKQHDGAADFLPNPVLELEVGDLGGAVRAELVIDRWGGHVGTQGQQLRLNGNAWMDLPLPTTMPDGVDPTCYLFQDNPVMEIPLDQLQEGTNTLEGASGDQGCYGFGWGQWGWYGALLRVYYNDDKPHPTGRIVSPAPGAQLGEHPVVEVEAQGGPGGGVTRVDVLAYYDGYDEDGDGHFTDWHGHLHYATLSGHVGTLDRPPLQDAPYAFRWNTRYVPDQPGGGVRLVARIRDYSGLWFVTDVVDSLSLIRENATVRLVPPADVPEVFWVRDGAENTSRLHLPEGYAPEQVEEAALHVRTWNGYNHGAGTLMRIGDWQGALPGIDHNFAYTIHPVPPGALQPGANDVHVRSDDEHHGVEFLWPGPALTLRMQKVE